MRLIMDLLKGVFLLCCGLTCAFGKKPEVRLAGGLNPCSGYVQVLHQGQWGFVCDNKWDDTDALVVCQEIHCGHVEKASKLERPEIPNSEFFLDEVQCTGHEKSLLDCPSDGFKNHKCFPHEEAFVTCNETIELRLSEGQSRCEGYVEVYWGGSWRAVCGNKWNEKAMNITCKELKCGLSRTIGEKPYYGQTRKTTSIDSVECDGSEPYLWQCAFNTIEQRGCGTVGGAWAICTEHKELRLKGDQQACSGRLEVLQGQNYSEVSPDHWTQEAGRETCQQLQCGEHLSFSSVERTRSGMMRLNASSRHTGNKSSLWENLEPVAIASNVNNTGSLLINCSANVTVRLSNGCVGVVEVFSNGSWGKVCHWRNTEWSRMNAQVVCQETGCGDFAFFPTRQHGQSSSDSFAMSDVNCSRKERFLWQCAFSPHTDKCSGKEVRVACTKSMTVRLVDGATRCAGRLEVQYLGQWGSVCRDGWSVASSRMVCQELNCGPSSSDGSEYPEEAEFGEASGTIWLTNVDCAVDKRFLSECVKETNFQIQSCTHAKDMGLICPAHVTLRLRGGSCEGEVEAEVTSSRIIMGWQADWSNTANLVCRQIYCGNAVYFSIDEPKDRPRSILHCEKNATSLLDCKKVELVTIAIDPASPTTYQLETFSRRETSIVEEGSGEDEVPQPTTTTTTRTNEDSPLSKATTIQQDDDSRPANTKESSLQNKTATTAIPQTYKTTTVNQDEDFHTTIYDDKLLQPTTTASTCEDENLTTMETTAVIQDEDSWKSPIMSITVNCSERPRLRLVGGNDRCSGRVEIFYQNTSGTVCGKYWNRDAANLVCKELGCGTAIDHMSVTVKNENPRAWLNFLQCTHETKFLWHCSSKPRQLEECQEGRHAEVICSESVHIRLVNGQSPCAGMVEVFYKYNWMKVCSTFSKTFANSICKRVNCGSMNKTLQVQLATSESKKWIDNVKFQCNNVEPSSTCEVSIVEETDCKQEKSAAVICSGHNQLYLIGPEKPCSGQVHIHQLQSDSHLGISTEGWDLEEARVVCRQLHCGTAISTNRTANVHRSIWGRTYNCTGNEASLFDCSRAESNGVSSTVVTVNCSERIEMQLDGAHRCAGRIQLKYNGTSGTICSHQWNDDDRDVGTRICKELKCSQFIAAHRVPAPGLKSMWSSYGHCMNTSLHPWQCLTSAPEGAPCPSQEAIAVVCSDSLNLQLTGGYTPCDGRVEIEYNGTWGTVCNNGWDNASAQLVCNYLKCGWPQLLSHSCISEDSQLPVVLTELKCRPKDNKLWRCPGKWGNVKCRDRRPVSLVCSRGVDPESRRIPIATVVVSLLVPLLLFLLIALAFFLRKFKMSARKRGQTSPSQEEKDDIDNSAQEDDGYDDADVIVHLGGKAVPEPRGVPDDSTVPILPAGLEEEAPPDEEPQKEFEEVLLSP